MDRVYEKAYGKINLSLDVLGRREDGYHDVSMVMQTVDIYDVITLSKLEGKDEIVLTTDVEDLPTGEGNIVYKAIKLIKEEYGIDTGVSAHIEKHLPIAAGMGGGSADAAAALRGMNRLFELGLKSERLEEFGVRLGADVPFLIKGGIALAEGIGEKLTALPDFPECSLVIVKLLGNVLEDVTIKKHGIIDEIKRLLVENGAVFSMMTGSGPTVFGIFENEEKAVMAGKRLSEIGGFELVEVTRCQGLE